MEDLKNPAYRVSILSIVLNVFLSVGKVLVGVIYSSNVLISDGVHSASDVLSTIVVLFGYKFSQKEADESHEYGHERFESIASLLLSIFLFLTGLFIGYNGVLELINHHFNTYESSSTILLLTALISVLIKEIMYRYTIIVGRRLKSNSLIADALHHRSDAFTSVAAIVGILGARFGILFLEPLASVFICLLIMYSSLKIFKETVDQLVDKACDEETTKQIKSTIEEIPGVFQIDILKTRAFGNKIYVDIEVAADRDMSFVHSHQIAEDISDKLRVKFPNIHPMVHMNPIDLKNNKIKKSISE